MQEFMLSALVAYQSQKFTPTIRQTPEIYQGLIQRAQKKSTKRFRAKRPKIYQPRARRYKVLKKTPPVNPDLPSVRKTLIVAPHPDDEVICCGLMMRDRIKQGEIVKVIYLTDGDAQTPDSPMQSRNYGKVRRSEAKKAMRSIGLNAQHLTFLNFPDASLDKLGEVPFTSTFTQQSKSMTANRFNQTDYTRPQLTQILKKLILEYSPDEIYVPSIVEDRHPDHRAATEIVYSILESHQTFHPAIFTYAVHTGKPRIQNQTINQAKLSWLRVFESQFHDQAHTDFMESFARQPELFGQRGVRIQK